MQLVNKHDSLVTHEEADITLCCYMLKAAASSAETVRIVCDDTDVFVLLVYWTLWKTIRKNIQMEKWDSVVLDIHATVVKLGDKCGQLTLYGQKNTDSVNSARYKMYMSRKKPPPLKKLPPTDNNLQLHVLRAHLQMMLWKAADQRHPPFDARDIRRFGWDVKEGGVVTPSVSNAPVAPQGLLDVVSCSCSAERKSCSEKRCSCHSAGLSCTEYCYCEGGRCVLQSLQ